MTSRIFQVSTSLGTVIESDAPSLGKGDQVILNGWGVGERHWGGLAERARVKADWLIRVPQGWTTRHAMAVGTAGYTSMLAVMDLEDQGMAPEKGEVLVTGGAGGVGSIAIALLAKAGYEVTASTGRPEAQSYMTSLGARQFIDRGRASRVIGVSRWSRLVFKPASMRSAVRRWRACSAS